MRFLTGETAGFLLNCLANLLVDARDADEDRGPNLFHGLRKLVELGAIDDLRSVAIHDVVECARGDMGERQEGDAGIGCVEGEAGGRKVLVGGDVAMREHHAFGLAGGAGGVNQRCEIVGLDGSDQGIEDWIALRALHRRRPARILEKAMAPSERVAIHDQDAVRAAFAIERR